MKSYDVMTLFAQQLERSIASSDECKTKVVITPSSVNEKGVVIKVSLLKTFPDREYQAKSNARTVRLRVSVSGTVESQTGLKMATELIENLMIFLSRTICVWKKLWKELTPCRQSGKFQIQGFSRE